jgi:hypothetical protein
MEPSGAVRVTARDRAWLGTVVPLVLVATLCAGAVGSASAAPCRGTGPSAPAATNATNGAVANFTASVNRLVELVGLAGSGLLALVWARVALSWFSNDVTKKVQAKDRARDALVGTLLFVAAVTGLVWGLAHWVVTGA